MYGPPSSVPYAHRSLLEASVPAAENALGVMSCVVEETGSPSVGLHYPA